MMAGGTQHVVCLARDGTDAPIPKLDTSTFQKAETPAEDEAEMEDDESLAPEENEVIQPKASAGPSPAKSQK